MPSPATSDSSPIPAPDFHGHERVPAGECSVPRVARQLRHTHALLREPLGVVRPLRRESDRRSSDQGEREPTRARCGLFDTPDLLGLAQPVVGEGELADVVGEYAGAVQRPRAGDGWRVRRPVERYLERLAAFAPAVSVIPVPYQSARERQSHVRIETVRMTPRERRAEVIRFGIETIEPVRIADDRVLFGTGREVAKEFGVLPLDPRGGGRVRVSQSFVGILPHGLEQTISGNAGLLLHRDERLVH